MSELEKACAAYVKKENLKQVSHMKSTIKKFKKSHASLPAEITNTDIELALTNAIRSQAASTDQRMEIYRPDPIKKMRKIPENVKVSAPFRFAALENNVAMPEDGRVDAMTPLREGLCACIDVDWVAESPLLIGQQKESVAEPMHYPHPTRRKEDCYVIPGSTLRGLIRSLTEALALGRLGQINGHHRYGFRDFNHPNYSSRYTVGDKDKVHAGWLTCSGGLTDPKWSIQPVRDWALICIDDLLDMIKPPVADRVEWVNQELRKKYEQVGVCTREGVYTFKERDFSFSRKHQKSVVNENGQEKDRFLCDAGNDVKGYFVFSGALNGKKAGKKHEYVFFRDEKERPPVPLEPALVEEFRRLHSKPSANKMVPDGTYGEFHETLQAGHPVPVFYVGDLDTRGDDFWFGFTRLFKVPHTRTVRQVLEEGHPAHTLSSGAVTEERVYQPDFVENLFGYVKEPKDIGLPEDERMPPDHIARRGRVAFSTAWIKPGQSPQISKPVKTVSMTPRASFAPFYLAACAKGGELDYSPPSKDGSVMLAGRKRYLPRFPSERNPKETPLCSIQHFYKDQPGEKTDTISSSLAFLHAPDGGELSFSSTIKLHNVTRAELGAILFAVTLGGDPQSPYRHMVGRGKPAGAGQMRVHSARLRVTMNDRRINPAPAEGDEILSAGGVGFCPEHTDETPSHSHRPFIKAFYAHMQKTKRDYPDLPSIKEVFASCDPRVSKTIGEDRLNYMDVGEYSAIRNAFGSHKQKNPAPIKPASPAGAAPIKRLLPVPDGSLHIWRAPAGESSS